MGSGGNMKRLELALTILFVALLILDLGTTVYGLSLGAQDQNPLIRLFSRWSKGTLFLLILKGVQMVVSLSLLVYAYRVLEPKFPRLYECFLAAMILYLAYIISNNFMVIRELLT
jgi:hypothetical protein